MTFQLCAGARRTAGNRPVVAGKWFPGGGGKPATNWMDNYLETGELTEAEIAPGLRQRTVKGKSSAVPVRQRV